MLSTGYRAVFLTAVLAVIPLVVVAGVRIAAGIGINDMTRDVAAIAGIHPLAGALSSLGILVWWTSASIWLFTAALILRLRNGADVGFVLCSGLWSAYFAFDDLFQFHEHLAPTYLKVPEKAVYGVLASGIALYLWRFRRCLWKPDGMLMLLALAFLSSCVVVDALERWLWRLGDWTYLVEDGLKWMGICFWTCFCVVRCARDLEPALKQASSA